MAQVWKVRLATQPRGLGRLDGRLIIEEEWLALGAVLGGLSTAFGLYLFATNRETEAYTLGIAGAVTGAFIAGARYLGSSE
jgi:hypothetical protein